MSEVVAILWIPTPLRVQGTLVLQPAKPEMIYAEVPGRLVTLNVRDGEWVKKDAVIATLSNPEKMRERRSLQEQYDVNWHKAQWFGASSNRDSRALSLQHNQMAEDLSPTRHSTSRHCRSLTRHAVAGCRHSTTCPFMFIRANLSLWSG